ncbi:chorismate-binding protein [Natronobiforma cellulositropha]|uniref:chorismate-binding protein n=1 Tax=Natronobiforma cellulositropha TaxID=1679076 RepID=UPI0021D5DD03|nr:chorismate-binding protein [Natronobiforma cellulositropha]
MQSSYEGFSHSREEFSDYADEDGHVVARFAFDLPTAADPLAAYAALEDASDSDYSFLFETGPKISSTNPDGAFSASAQGQYRRFSYVGYDPAAVITVDDGETTVEVEDPRYADLIDVGGDNTVDALRQGLPDASVPESGDAPYEGGLLGFLAYDAVYDLWLGDRLEEADTSDTADAQFVLNTKTIVYDHANERASIVFTPVLEPGEETDDLYDQLVAEALDVAECVTGVTLETDGFHCTGSTIGARGTYCDAVEHTREHIVDGDIYQGVISRERTYEGSLDPYAFYEDLRQESPSPYMYLLQFGDRSVIGASPETLVSVQSGTVVSNPLAGTCERGSSPIEDRKNAGGLLADEKEQAEHVMLVDLARNDVRRVARPGSVSVDEFMNVVKHATVQHIESVVSGELDDGYDAFDALEATFPVGTLSGAPKLRAMEIIDEIEETPRGIYGGGIGYVSWDADVDVAIAIRTATVEHRESDHVTVRAGAGVVANSDPDSEYEETENKLGGILGSLENISVPTDDQRTKQTHL